MHTILSLIATPIKRPKSYYYYNYDERLCTSRICTAYGDHSILRLIETLFIDLSKERKSLIIILTLNL